MHPGFRPDQTILFKFKLTVHQFNHKSCAETAKIPFSQEKSKVQINIEIRITLKIILSGLVQQQRRITARIKPEQIDRKIEQTDRKLEQIDRKLEQIDRHFKEIDRNHEQVEKLNRLIETINRQIETMNRQIDTMNRQNN